MNTKLLPLLGLLLISTVARGVEEDGPIGSVSDFTLTERSGKSVALEDLRGKVWVASFLITRCPDGKCPQVATTLERLQQDLARHRDVLFVTFTTDPTHDTPNELRDYADRHHADPQRWLFLTGSEEAIDRLMRSFLVRAQEEPYRQGRIDHSQKLMLIDRQGNIRGIYDGLDHPSLPDGAFEDNLRRVRQHVARLVQPDLPAWMPTDFPAFNATLNALSACLLLVGYGAIRQRLVRLHAVCMLTAIAVSALFLTSYLFFHLYVKGGQPTRFADQAASAPAWVSYLYHAILLSHTLLAIPVAPLALVAAYQGLLGKIERHIRLARWTLPIWLYVSITGVVVYVMLYRLFPS